MFVFAYLLIVNVREICSLLNCPIHVVIVNHCSLHILCNREKQTPLHLACQEGHTLIVRKLLEKCPSQEDGRKILLKAHDNEGNTALHLAIESLRVRHKYTTSGSQFVCA